MIYLDNQASTPTDPLVLKKINESIELRYANPHSSENIVSLLSGKAIESSISHIAKYLGCYSEEVIITSGATESNNMAIKSICSKVKLHIPNRYKILASCIEHKSILDVVFSLDKNQYEVSLIPVDEYGLVIIDQFVEMLDEQVLLVCIQHTNNEIGTIQNIQLLAEYTHNYGAFFHCDGAQAYYEELNVKELDVDSYSISGHKIYGPKGIGALYISQDIMTFYAPIIHGGGQQQNLRSGTMPTFLIEALGKACIIMNENKLAEAQKLNILKEYFLNLLNVNNINYRLNGSLESRHPGNINICLPFIASEFISYIFNDIAVSTGSACNEGIIDSSYVLKAIGIQQPFRDQSLRISIGRFNNKEDILFLIEKICSYRKDLSVI